MRNIVESIGKNKKIVNVIGYIILACIFVYIYLFGKISYTADKCVSGYKFDGTTVTAAPGDTPDYLICNYNNYLPAGLYTFRIDGYNEYTEYNTYEIYADEYGGTIAKGVFVPGAEIPVQLDTAVRDLDVRVLYQDAGTVTVSKVTITPLNTIGTYLKAILILIFSTAIFIFFLIYEDKLIVKIGKVIAGIILFITGVLAQFLFIEALYDADSFYREIPTWLLHESGSEYRPGYILILSCTVLFFIDLFILFVCKYYCVAIPVCTIISGVYALIGYNYYLSRGDVFTFSQFRLAADAARVVGEYTIVIPTTFWIGIGVSLLFALLVFGGYILDKWEQRLVFEIVLFACAAVSVANVKPSITRHGDSVIVFVGDAYYRKNGFVVGTIVMLPEVITEPESYSEEKILAISGDYNVSNDDVNYDIDKPTIIYIQCETLFDMTYVTEQNWSENPLEYLNMLSEDYYVADMISPMAGGGTCNVEYEMLTGYTYYNVGGTPYVNELTNGEISLVSDLKDYGYNTVAIHTNTGAFFNRKTAYTYLGFDEMIFEEQLGETPEEFLHGRRWANDLYAYEALIDSYESRDKNKPYFAHVVTTQNHGGWEVDYDEHGITVEGDISIEENRQLQTYLNLEKESMVALESLLDYFDSVEDNVIIVFWGDHCPALTKLGVEDNSLDYVVNSHKTPLLVWNNYGATFDFGEQIAAYNFTPMLMQQLGMNNDYFMNYSANNDVPTVVVGTIDIENGDNYISVNDMSDEQKEIRNNLWLLQYDREYGRGYAYN